METKAAKDLEKELLFSQPHISDEWPAAREEAEAFCEDYKAFLNNAKTEREAAAEIEKRLVAAGYRPFGHMAKSAWRMASSVERYSSTFSASTFSLAFSVTFSLNRAV